MVLLFFALVGFVGVLGCFRLFVDLGGCVRILFMLFHTKSTGFQSDRFRVEGFWVLWGLGMDFGGIKNRLGTGGRVFREACEFGMF
jgi:hypothetical protein